MKKRLIMLMSILVLIATAGCSEQTQKLQYITEMADTVPDLTGAYVGLHDLYTSPLSYTAEEWKTEFRKHKGEIEEEYNQVKNLTPLDSLTDAHASLIQVLEMTIEANNLIDQQIQAGEELDFTVLTTQLNELKAGLENALSEITAFKESK